MYVTVLQTTPGIPGRRLRQCINECLIQPGDTVILGQLCNSTANNPRNNCGRRLRQCTNECLIKPGDTVILGQCM